VTDENEVHVSGKTDNESDHQQNAGEQQKLRQ
jgi:hypothetical protein